MTETTTIRLRDNIIRDIRDNLRCKNRLTLALNKSSRQLDRYLDKNNILLTTAIALDIISEELSIPQYELLTPEE